MSANGAEDTVAESLERAPAKRERERRPLASLGFTSTEPTEDSTMEQLRDSASSLEDGEVPPVPENTLPEISSPEGTGLPTPIVVQKLGLIKAVTQLFGSKKSPDSTPPPPPPDSPPQGPLASSPPSFPPPKKQKSRESKFGMAWIADRFRLTPPPEAPKEQHQHAT